MTVLFAARIVTGQEVLAPGWLAISGSRITAVGPGRPDHIDRDLGDAVVVPGFVDPHVHGGGGGAFTGTEVDSALQAVETHRRHGTTTTVASLVTAGPAELLHSVSMLAELVEDGIIGGIHLEGPWISTLRCGAQDPSHVRDPDRAEIAALFAAGRGTIRMVSVAPERPGGYDAIRQVVDAGAVAAVGHTDADYDQTVAAIAAGARVATHLFNAMPPVHHRAPGPVIALLEDPRVSIELIADGTHLHPAIHRHIVRSVGSDRVTLVTDAMSAAGLGDGDYQLGSMPVVVAHGVAHIAGTDTIAGGTATMDQLFRRAVQQGSPTGSEPPRPPDDPLDAAALLSAVRQTSVNAARTLGRTDIGLIRPGMRADLVVVNQRLAVTEIIIGGISTHHSVAPLTRGATEVDTSSRSTHHSTARNRSSS